MTIDSAAFAIVGLGNIGGNLAIQARERGLGVVGYDPRPPADDVAAAGVQCVHTLHELAGVLAPPRIVFLYVPAGAAVDDVLATLRTVLEPGDLVVDGGNSYWRDSLARHRQLTEQGLEFVDLGTSGGLAGARNGACFMAGGEARAVARIEPILRALAVEGGFVHAGPPGAGHFVKLVHNGIEFGMLQAIGEGFDLLEHHQDALPVGDILQAWRHGSVIRSWLVDLLAEQYQARGGLGDVPGYVEDTGEVNWLVEDALRMEVPVPVIAQAVMQLLQSRDDERGWARAVAAMRHGFGNHPIGADERIARNRGLGRRRDRS